MRKSQGARTFSAIARKTSWALLVLVSFASCAGSEIGSSGIYRRMIVRVVDGDTFGLDGGDRIRLAGANAPEIDEELGLEARRFAIDFAYRKDVEITSKARDGYGRLITDVVVDGKRFAPELVRAGLAHAFLIPPIDKDEEARLLSAQAEARTAKRGIWATDRYRGAFHITSFHANPRGNEAKDPNQEYMRISNVTCEQKDIGGYTISNRKGETFTFPTAIIPAGHTLIFAAGQGDDSTDPQQQIVIHWGRKWPVWANKGDTATLKAPDGVADDVVEYDPAHRKVYPRSH